MNNDTEAPSFFEFLKRSDKVMLGLPYWTLFIIGLASGVVGVVGILLLLSIMYYFHKRRFKNKV